MFHSKRDVQLGRMEKRNTTYLLYYAVKSTQFQIMSFHFRTTYYIAYFWSQDFDFVIVMGTDYSFYVKSIATYAPTFSAYNDSVLA